MSDSLEAIAVGKTYPNGTEALADVSLRVTVGETLVLIGESGCGKSVACRSFLQIVHRPGRIVSGEILFSRPLEEGKSDAYESKSLESGREASITASRSSLRSRRSLRSS